MKLFSQEIQKETSEGISSELSKFPTLDVKNSNTFWSRKVFEILDLHLSTRDPEKGHLSAQMELQRASDNFGKNQNPISPLLLSFIIEKKEVAILTGLLGRQIVIEEELQTSYPAKESLLEELQHLRAENVELSEENTILKRSLMEIQRPRRVS